MDSNRNLRRRSGSALFSEMNTSCSGLGKRLMKAGIYTDERQYKSEKRKYLLLVKMSYAPLLLGIFIFSG